MPDEQNLTENGTVPSEVTSASSSVGLVRTLNLGLPVLALVLLGGMFDFTGRDVRRTAKTGGVSLAIGGLLGAGIGLFLGGIASGAAESALDADSAEVAAMSDGIVAVVDSTFSTVMTQGLIVAGVGILAVRVVFAEQRGYLDSVLGGDGQQGQYQQEHRQYQDGQYQHGQQQQYDQQQYNQQGQGQYQNEEQYQQGRGQHDQQGHGQYDQPQESGYEQSRTDEQSGGDQESTDRYDDDADEGQR